MRSMRVRSILIHPFQKWPNPPFRIIFLPFVELPSFIFAATRNSVAAQHPPPRSAATADRITVEVVPNSSYTSNMAEVRSRLRTKGGTYGEVSIGSLDFFVAKPQQRIIVTKDKIVK